MRRYDDERDGALAVKKKRGNTYLLGKLVDVQALDDGVGARSAGDGEGEVEALGHAVPDERVRKDLAHVDIMRARGRAMWEGGSLGAVGVHSHGSPSAASALHTQSQLLAIAHPHTQPASHPARCTQHAARSTQHCRHLTACQSRIWSMQAAPAEAADDAPRAAMMAAPRFCTVGMKSPVSHLVGGERVGRRGATRGG